MHTNRGHNQITRWMANQAERESMARAPRARDSLVTLMLGTLSMGLGGLTFVLALAGLAGQQVPGWHQQENVWADIFPRQYEPELVENLFGSMVRVRRQEIVARLWIPSGSCVFLSLIGMVLGGLGVAQGIPERRYSVFSVVGFSLSLLATVSGVACLFFLTQYYGLIR